jgi:membrane dipeptidase
MGVRFVTPVWGGDSCIGGAHNTENGLTKFGYEAVKKMVSLGIIPDISHSSVKTAAEIMDIAEAAGRPAIATHSNSKSVCDHTRNLSDEQFRRVCALDGIVGISLCPSHLFSENANVDSVIRHIDKYMELGGERHIAIGCDLDGTNPHSDFSSIADIGKIADKLSSIGYTDEVIHGIFFENAANFVSKYI